MVFLLTGYYYCLGVPQGAPSFLNVSVWSSNAQPRNRSKQLIIYIWQQNQLVYPTLLAEVLHFDQKLPPAEQVH